MHVSGESYFLTSCTGMSHLAGGVTRSPLLVVIGFGLSLAPGVLSTG